MKTVFSALLILFVAEECLCSSSSGAGVAPQSCGTTNKYYVCPSGGVCQIPAPNDRCRPRSQRCTANDNCALQNNEDMCFSDPVNPGAYTVREGHVLLGIFGSKRTFFEHRFIQYRGFTYEFGSSYSVQILDVTDPCYKYKNNKDINSNGIQNVGSSYCTWEEASILPKMWKKKKYNLVIRNCKHFSAALKKYLTTGTCALPPTSAQTPNTTDPVSNSAQQHRATKLEEEADAILTDCRIVCCDSSGSSSSRRFQASIGVVFLITAVLYTV